MKRKLRVAAYAVCVQDGRILLARWVARDGTRRWTLPGGGMDHGEDPVRTVVREVSEETGCTAEVTALLGIDSLTTRRPGRFGSGEDFQSLRIVYEARITAGEPRPEADGSTDLAAWHALDSVAALERVALVDIGLELRRARPALGRVDGAVHRTG